MRPSRLRQRVAQAFAAVLIIGCAAYEIAAPGGVVSLRIAPDTVQLDVGDSVAVRALALDASGALLVNEPVEWSSSATAIVSVDGLGMLRALAPGLAQVRGRVGTYEDSALVLVQDIPGAITAVAGGTQSATGGQPVPVLPRVRVNGSTGGPLAGVEVTFAVASGGGALIGPAVVTTNAAGEASPDGWILGTALGANTLTATVADDAVTGNPLTFTATVVAGPPSASRSGVSAAPGTIGASDGTDESVVTVTVRDAAGAAAPGVSVTLAATGAGNTITQPTAVTDANGRATGRISATAIGAKVISASVAGVLPLDSTTTVTVVPGAPALVERVAGDAQSATVNTAVTTAPRVRVRDAFGHAVAGANVTFAVTGGGGSVTGTATVATDGTGEASPAAWVLGTIVGTNTLTATVAGTGIAGNPIGFSATGTPAAPSAATSGLVAAPTTIAATSGAQQTTLTVRVRDAFGNAVPNATATLAASGGGNTFVQPAAPTDAAGLTTGTMSSTLAGAKVVTATVNGTIVVDSTATITVTPGVPASIETVAGDAQSAAAGTAVATVPRVRVRDAFGTPVPGVSVLFEVASGGGSVTAPVSVATDAAGEASPGAWVLGPSAGANSLTATASGAGITGNPRIFTATATAGAPSATRSGVVAAPGTIVVSNGSRQSVITVRVRDAFGNAIAGASVSLSATGAGNTITQPVGTTDAAGQVTGAVSSTTVGTKVISALVNGTVTLDSTASVVAEFGAPASVSATAGTGQVARINTSVAVAPTVRVLGTGGLPVPGVNVTFAVVSGGSVVGPAVVSTDANGEARPGGWTLGATEGTYSLTATATGAGITGNPVTFTATAIIGTPSAARSGLTATPDTIVASSGANQATLRAVVRDATGLPIEGVAVQFIVSGTGNTLTQPAGLTDANGVATGALSSTASQTKVITAVAGVVALDSSATVVVRPGPPASVSAIAGNGQSATVSTAVATLPAVRVLDAFGTAVPGATVTFAVTGGAGSLGAPTVVQTDAAGEARSGTWTLGSAPGANTLSATVTGAGITGNPVSFTATALVGPPSASRSGLTAAPTSIAASAGGTVSTITVRVRDSNGNPIPGLSVSLAATGTGNTVTQPAAVTNASGVATGTISSTVAAVKVVSATVSGSVLVDSTASVTVNPAAASQLAMITQPAGAVANTPFSTQPVVEVRDAFGNRVTSATNAVTVAVTSGDGGVVTGTTTVNAVGGRASFSGLSIRGPLVSGDTLGTGAHTIGFTAPGLTSATSASFTVNISFSYNVQFMLRLPSANPLSQRGCTGCHSGTTSIDLYANLVNFRPSTTGCYAVATRRRVVPNDPTNSMLYELVRTQTPVCSFSMPSVTTSGGTIWGSRMREILRLWIVQGALNN